MRQVLGGLWARVREALAVALSSIRPSRRPRAKAGRARRETPRDPQARGIIISLISHRDRFDCRTSEKAWEEWSRGRPAAMDCHETQKAAMAQLQEILDRNYLRGRLEPLWPSRDGSLTPCVFLPQGIDRGTKWRELRNLAWETRWWPIEVDDLDLLAGCVEQASPGRSVQEALDEARVLDVLEPEPNPEETPTTEMMAVGAVASSAGPVAASSEAPSTDGTTTQARPDLAPPSEGASAGAGPHEAPPASEKACPGESEPVTSKPWRFLDDPEADPLPGDFLVLVPTSQPWEIAAHLFYGGWDECPRSAVHVAWWKRWFDLYGAEIRTISGRALDLYVPQRPATREEARDLLGEHARYCPLTLGSNGATDEERAVERLLKNHSWAFWWD